MPIAPLRSNTIKRQKCSKELRVVLGIVEDTARAFPPLVQFLGPDEAERRDRRHLAPASFPTLTFVFWKEREKARKLFLRI